MKLSIVVCAAALLLPASGHAQTVTDPQITSIVVTANQVDIDAGKVAAARAMNPRVKAFGERMASDHAGLNKSAGELVTKLGVRPEDNPTSQSRQSLKTDGQKSVAALDKTLIPNARNAELKALLVKV